MNIRPTVFAALLLALASSRQGPRFDITPGSVLTDQPFTMTLSGFPAGQDVTVRVDGNRGIWQSSATFRSDTQGRIDVADPMRLIWSVSGQRPAAPGGAVAQPWTFTAEVDGKVIATQTLVRRAVAEGVRVAQVQR